MSCHARAPKNPLIKILRNVTSASLLQPQLFVSCATGSKEAYIFTSKCLTSSQLDFVYAPFFSDVN